MVFIISKNDNILTVCDTIENVYNNILTYTRIILYCDKNKIDFLKDLKIIKFDNGYPHNSYKIDLVTLDLYDENNNKIHINNCIISRNKVELEVLLKKDNYESEINLFIPLDNVESSDNYELENLNIYIKDDQNIQPIQRIQSMKLIKDDEEDDDSIKSDNINQIEMLKAKIELEKIRLSKNNAKYESKFNNFLNIKHQVGLIEKEFKLKKEKEDENIRIFLVDKNTFNTMLNEIINNQRDPDDIPEIFKDKFKIFQKLKSEIEYLHLTQSEEYDKYNEIKNLMNIGKSKLKTKYDGMFENDTIYKKLYNDLSDLNHSDDESESDSELDYESDDTDNESNNVEDVDNILEDKVKDNIVNEILNSLKNDILSPS